MIAGLSIEDCAILWLDLDGLQVRRSSVDSFFAEFPKDQNGKAVNEWLFLLATKSKFEALDSESSENFHKRLDELGRENWRLAQMGYTILAE